LQRATLLLPVLPQLLMLLLVALVVVLVLVGLGQGLTLVHCSAQLESSLTQYSP
jgi:hypothetical protein